MSTKVVSAPAKVAKPLNHKQKAAPAAEHAQPVQDDDAKLAGKDARVTEESAKVILAHAEDGKDAQAAPAEHAAAGDSGTFSFAAALAEAAATSGSLVSEVDAGGYAQSDDSDDTDRSGGLIIGLGALGLVGLGAAVLAGGSNGEDEVLNRAPVFGAATQSVTVAEDTAAGVVVTPGATDADGNTITYTVSNPPNGTATVNANGTITYVPDANYSGSDSFTITASDGNGGTATQTVNVTVTPVNDGPVAGAASIDVNGDEDGDITVTPTFTDPEGDDLTYTVTTQPTNGTVTVNDDGTLTFTPDADFNGTDTFVVTATDESGLTATQTVNVTVDAVNDAPVAGPDNTTTITVEEGESAPITVDFTDVDNTDDELTAEVTTDPTNGTVVDGVYTPNDGFIGTDSFVVTVSDGENDVSYTVNVNVVENDNNLEEVSIDVPASGNPVTIDASGDDFQFNDNVDTRTDVILTGFDEGDVIVVDGATEGQYSFGTAPGDANDLRITFNDGTNFTQIVIDDILADNAGFVFDYDSAVAAVGFDFITFG